MPRLPTRARRPKMPPVRTSLQLALVSLFAVLPFDADARQWIAIVAPEFREAVEPLCKQRLAEGWEVTVLDGTRARAELVDEIARLAQSDEQCALLLVGDVAETSTGTSVASGKGTHARMAGKFSDAPWSTADGRLKNSVPTGRLPARSPEEAGVMVQKILGWPERARAMGSFPNTRCLLGNHGMPPPIGNIADSLMNRIVLDLVRQFPSQWQLEVMAHINESPWQVFFPDLDAAASAMMKAPSTILAYMGHSHRRGADSANQPLLTVDQWRSLPLDSPQIGLFFSCGCHTCDFDPKEEAFGVVAMRAAGGPAAVIGSQGETYAAMGYLGLSGMLTRMSAEPSPRTVGDFWQGVQQGLREGPIDAGDFKLMDMADGSGGKLPLETQRSEHLESWMLLGDPAMPLAPEPLTIKLTGKPTASADELEVVGELPPSLANAKLRLTLERHPSQIRTDLPAVPASGEPRREATRKRRALSNDHVLATKDITAEGIVFRTTISLPSSPSAGPLVIRASSLDEPSSASGIAQVPDSLAGK